MLIASLALVILLPLVTVEATAEAKEPTLYSNPRDFYHELTSQRQQELLYNANLNDPVQLEALRRLLSQKAFNIAGVYNQACSTICPSRAKEILHLPKDLEMLLLGPACLSLDIIETRKTFPHMWPPTGFPLLVDGFKPHEIPTIHIKDILTESLKRPSWWHSSDWIYNVNWNEMNDSSFWRMIPVDYYHYSADGALISYLKRALTQVPNSPTQRDLEEFLMKSIRILDFKRKSNQVLYEINLDMEELWSKFSLLNDSWSMNTLNLLKAIYSTDLEARFLSENLLQSGLLSLDSWNGHVIDTATATNDIFELLTIAVRFSKQGNQVKTIEQLLSSFLNGPIDWSKVCPVVVHAAFKEFKSQLCNSFIKEHINKLLKDDNALAVLPDWLLVNSTNLQAQVQAMKKSTSPLRDAFAGKEKEPLLELAPYSNLLYKKWARDRKNWPGLVAAHKLSSLSVIQAVFKQSHSEYGTWDPKTDAPYDQAAWDLAFASIRFGIQHGIPDSPVPSTCFLSALLCYQKMKRPSVAQVESWIEIMEELGQRCSLPKKNNELVLYQVAMEAALRGLYFFRPKLSSASVELLQALIRGDHNNDLLEETNNGLESRLMALRFQ